MLNRRSFLKRLGAGSAAAWAALQYKAPTKPPNVVQGTDTVVEVGEESAPVAELRHEPPKDWARVDIDGRKYDMCSLNGPTMMHEPIEECVSGERLFYPGFKETILELEVWAEDEESYNHLAQRLGSGQRNVSVHIQIPSQADLEAKGFLTGVSMVQSSQWSIPTMVVQMGIEPDGLKWNHLAVDSV